MANKRIPKGPWKNGVYSNGDYDAIVHCVERGAYGRENGSYFRIVLWLVQARKFLATNIYLGSETEATALQRIWHFCQACGESDAMFYARLHEFCAKHICVKLVRISPSQSGADECYSDVHRFLKPTTALDDAAWEAYREAIGQKSKVNSDDEKETQTKKKVLDLFSKQ